MNKTADIVQCVHRYVGRWAPLIIITLSIYPVLAGNLDEAIYLILLAISTQLFQMWRER